ncbi:MAG: MBOAT family protein [Acetobacteraceae bacterium]|nr:MBOAT family protein [Acetobacteraceae bacterium]MBV8525216.1 MBOAT family protein [Acetobacteraceae bacterium]
MLFSSQPFILGFLPIALAGFFLLGQLDRFRPKLNLCGRNWGLGWLVAASLFFYAWCNPPFVLLLMGSVLVNYGLGQRILRLARVGHGIAARRWLAIGIAGNLTLIGIFKYADFLLNVLTAGYAPHFVIFLPLAISFFTFQQIMFLVDGYRQRRPAASLLTYAGFVSLFPHLIAGPLVRPGEIIPQLVSPALALPSRVNVTDGLTIFLLGLGKKLVLADAFGFFADIGFDAAGNGEVLSFAEAWYAALSYALQIYFDFSAYSDMAIGLARMLNVRFPVNFDSPYKAANISDFWRRWHITLSQFLRDYVYIPLGGNRRGPARKGLNMMLTMLLGGLWHGAAWNFVLWGGLHGVFLILCARSRLGLPALLARMLTLAAVVVGWVPFRASGFHATWIMLRGMMGLEGLALPQMITGAFPALQAIAQPVPVLRFLGDARTLSFPEVTAMLALGWFIVLCMPNVHELTERGRTLALTAGFGLTMQALFFAPRVAPFLYFQF